MYSLDWDKVFRRRAAEVPGKRRISATVWALGFTSMFTDISSEMVNSILPLYFVAFLGLGPVAFGWIDGVQQGATALLRVLGGLLADRFSQYKRIAVIGYALSAFCRVALISVGNTWTAILTIISLDRFGKGIRTAPRDALIANSTEQVDLATAFSAHRSLDGVGAAVGPLIAFAVLFLFPGAFHFLFIVSFGFALIGLAVILIFVPNLRSSGKNVHIENSTPASLWSVLRIPAFRRQLTAGALLGLVTVSDSFIYLLVHKNAALPATAFPLLFVATFLCTAITAVPCGRIADRFGRAPVFIVGHASLATAYALLAFGSLSQITLVVGIVSLLGLYYASTDGVITALAASILPPSHAGTGLAILATGINVAKLAASVLFGYAWYYFGTAAAISIFLSGLVAAGAVGAYLLLNRSHAYAS